jgi:protocatechuate 3,4-dioxygenase beta subunit
MMARWRTILLNRFVLVPGAVVLAIALWNVYVATHNNGLLTGRVTDSAGQPVADATVSLWVYNFTTYEEKERVKTGADGVFRFTDNPSHRIQVSAEKPGVGRSPRIPVFLYFRGQDTTLDTPLRLAGAS